MDEREAARLVGTYADLLLRVSYIYLKNTSDAEDICQTVFLKYLTAAPAFESPEHERAWMLRTAINACRDKLKSAHARKTAPLEAAGQREAPPAPDSALLDAVFALPEAYRAAVWLHYYAGYSAAEIGSMTGASEAAVHKRLSRARALLRAALTEVE